MNKLKVVRSLVVATIAMVASHVCTGISSAQTKKVFAHYMVCNRDYGDYSGAGLVTAYQHDIQDAINYKIDGFALNIGGWGGNYIGDTAALFQAAQNVSPNFKLFFSVDMSAPWPAADIVNVMQMYKNHPNYFKYNNRPVMSTISGHAVGGGGTGARDWWLNNVLNPLRNNPTNPCNVYFVPNFAVSASDTPNLAQLTPEYNLWWKDVVDGMYYFGATGLPKYTTTDPSILTTIDDFGTLLHSHGKTYMAPVSPQYWGSKQKPDRRYFEYEGGRGLIAQWQSIINASTQPEWVELTTWNDFDESSHFTPMNDVNAWWPYTQHPTPGFYKKRNGIAQLNAYFIDWYKNYAYNQAPPPPAYMDNVYWMYRTHSKNAVTVPADPEGTVNVKIGNVQDNIYITTILIGNNATLTVNSGGVITNTTVNAGITTTDIPFHPGAQSFTLKRNGVSICSSSGDSISANNAITEYNYNYTSGWMHG